MGRCRWWASKLETLWKGQESAQGLSCQQGAHLCLDLHRFPSVAPRGLATMELVGWAKEAHPRTCPTLGDHSLGIVDHWHPSCSWLQGACSTSRMVSLRPLHVLRGGISRGLLWAGVRGEDCQYLLTRIISIH